MKTYKETTSYFFDSSGAALKAGTVLKNPSYADTLALLAKDGADAFYKGKIAEDIVKTVREAAGNPGVLCSPIFPIIVSSSESRSASPIAHSMSAAWVRRRQEQSPSAKSSAFRKISISRLWGHRMWKAGASSAMPNVLPLADRERYVADPNFVPLPIKGLLDKSYLGERSRLLDGDKALSKDAVKAGEPGWDHALLFGRDAALELPSTSHFVIVDKEGNVVSMTTTIENGFGSRLMTNGFLLNNELTDFSFKTHDGRPADCQSGRAWKAAALLDGTNHRDEGRKTTARHRLARWQPDHRICGAGAHCLYRLGYARGGDRGPAASHQSLRDLRYRGRHQGGRHWPNLSNHSGTT